MDFCLFFDLQRFLHLIAFGLVPSGLGSDGFFFSFLTASVFLHFIAFGLRPSGLGCDKFFFVFDFHCVFAFYCLWFNAVGCRLRWIFFFVF